MSKIRVAIAGTVGKSVSFDPSAGARAEAAVAALAAQISAGIGGTIYHRNLRELQVGDDHPQYTGWQFPETIVGQWNFQTIPQIQGETLAEYIQDVVGADFFDFLQDTTSVVWTYAETANELEANVPPEFVQDTVGAMLTNTSSVTLAYNDGAGTFNAAVVDEYIQDLVDALMIDSTSIAWTYSDVGNTLSAATINANPTGTIGLSAVNGSAATPMRSDAAPALSQAIVPTWTGIHTHTQNLVSTFAGSSATPNILVSAGAPNYGWYEDDATSGDRRWDMRASGGQFLIRALADDGSTSNPFFVITRSANTITSVGITANSFTTAGDFWLAQDNDELQLGAGQDLRFYHDGTNSSIRNDTGVLNINQGATTVGRFDSDATGGNTRFMVYDVDNGALERVSVGAADSGGAGFKVLRIPN